MHLDVPTTDQITDLLDHGHAASVSIYLPTGRSTLDARREVRAHHAVERQAGPDQLCTKPSAHTFSNTTTTATLPSPISAPMVARSSMSSRPDEAPSHSLSSTPGCEGRSLTATERTPAPSFWTNSTSTMRITLWSTRSSNCSKPPVVRTPSGNSTTMSSTGPAHLRWSIPMWSFDDRSLWHPGAESMWFPTTL